MLMRVFARACSAPAQRDTDLMRVAGWQTETCRSGYGSAPGLSRIGRRR
jgi:hypothetical protein